MHSTLGIQLVPKYDISYVEYQEFVMEIENN